MKGKNNRFGRKIPELILPAGDLDKLKYALAYGADAVYAGLPDMSLRANLNYFTVDSLKEGIQYTHKLNKKIYITLNMFAHEGDLKKVKLFADEISDYKPDAFIISDPGVLRILNKNSLPGKIPVHLSTQMNTTNSESILFWADQGIKRVILARELTYLEIKEIIEKIYGRIETEIFIHGAMCVSYSGRCLLSNFLTGRDSNRGECNQPCRWRYYLVEESRPDRIFTIIEEKKGTYILNSRDLCLLDKMGEIKKLNIDGFKVEGRTKNAFYLSLVGYVYRRALDLLYGESSKVEDINFLMKILELTDNHGFTHGFMFPNDEIKQNLTDRNYKKQNILGYVNEKKDDNCLIVKVKNPVTVGNSVILINPEGYQSATVDGITDLKGVGMKKAYGARGDVVKLFFNIRLMDGSWEYGLVSKSVA